MGPARFEPVFTILLDPNVKNPTTEHWDRAIRSFNELL